MSTKGFLALIATTMVEAVGLIVWLYFVLSGNEGFGIALLAAGLFAERIFVYLLIRTMEPQQIATSLLIPLEGLAIVELIVWIIWLVLFNQVGILAAEVFLFIFLLLEHSAAAAFITKEPALSYVTHFQTILFSAIEAIGAGIWLILVINNQALAGGVVLLIALFVEHAIQGSATQIHSTTTQPT